MSKQSSDPRQFRYARTNKALPQPGRLEFARVLVGINVTPLAFESLGVRSMCTLVRTRDVTVLLDAGVALGPRFRLMPHPREFIARNEARERINEAAAKAEVITISRSEERRVGKECEC